MAAFMRLLLHHRQQTRSFLVLGSGAQDACVITLLSSPLLIHPSLLLGSASHGGRSSGELRCLSSSVWGRQSLSTNASGEAQIVEQDWEEYFADPSQWWDNRFYKMNPKSFDYKHKVTKKELWVDVWSTPPWVKTMLKLLTLSALPSHVGHRTSDSQEIVQPSRSPEGNSGRRITLPTRARESKRTVQVGGGNIRMQCAKTTSEAIDVLKNRLQRGIPIDSYGYVEVLKRCVRQEDLGAVEEIHECIVESGMQQNIYVANSLLNVYIRSGRLEDACRVFVELVKKDVISWNVMIGGYAQHSCAKDAMEVFNQMRQEGVRPDAVTYLSILKACASPSVLKWGEEVHAYIREGGFESDVRVGTALLQMYARCGSIKKARNTFDLLGNRNVITWNVMIGGLAQHGLGSEAFELFLQMKREGLEPTAITYMSMLTASAIDGSLDWVKEVHSHAREAGFELDLRVGNALVHMYAKCGSIDDARLTFDKMEERDVISWNVIILAYAECGRGEEAYALLLRMKQEGLKPDAFTYASILNACANAGTLEWVREVHSHARDGGFDMDLRVGNALVHMYAKCGSIDDARLVFDRMEERDVISWNVMIGGLAQHGCGSEALEVFGNMNAVGVKPDGYSFVALLSACSHTGLVDEGRRLFRAMSQDYGIVPSVVHWTCMADILGRAGHLEDAKLLIDNMPVEPVEATWGALLGACKSYGNVELGELAAKERLKLIPKDPSTYVLLSNIYAAAEKWEKVSLVRIAMQERGIRKEPGRSWIEVDDKIHAFVVGDTSHPETKEIYAELSRLTEKIKAAGYLADTRLVLHDVDEKDKEFSLCSHSEKLAIAYGLIHTPSSKVVRVYKNLRVCSNCHEATKLISKVTRREIVVRDVNRFHHFRDGLCSCKDYCYLYKISLHVRTLSYSEHLIAFSFCDCINNLSC